MPVRYLAIAILTVLMSARSVASQEESNCLENVNFTSRDPSAEQNWDCATRADMQICSRVVPGSAIREVVAKAVIEAPSARVFTIISDYPHYPQFMPYVTESEVVKHEGEELWVFQQL